MMRPNTLLAPALLLVALVFSAGVAAAPKADNPGQGNKPENAGPPADRGKPDGKGKPEQPGCKGRGDCFTTATGRTFRIEAGSGAESETLTALFQARTGDTIEFGPGVFHFTTSLVMSHKDGITIKGAGRDDTVLSFAGSGTPEGLTLSHMKGIAIEDLTVIDTPGFSIKVSDSRHVVMRNIRAMWSSADGRTDPANPATLNVACTPNVMTIGKPKTQGVTPDFSLVTPEGGLPNLNDAVDPAYVVTPDYIPASSNGGYAIYPVLSEDVLLDNVEAVGASDAGIYVGQSKDVIVKNSRAIYNVAGYEIENTDNADMFDNLAECNTTGFLVFDLPGLNRYGDRTRIFNNLSRYNNIFNFAPGGVVGAVPAGNGMLILGYDHIEIFDNVFEYHRTSGIVIASHELLEGGVSKVGDKRMDLYTEGMHTYRNTFRFSGYLPQEPEVAAVQELLGQIGEAAQKQEPGKVNPGHDSLLPALLMVKGMHPMSMQAAQAAGTVGGPRGAHIVWDGMFDKAAYECAKDGHVLPGGGSVTYDEYGKPQYLGAPALKCRYNAYKFTSGDNKDLLGNDIEGTPNDRIHPRWWHCHVTDGPDANTFSEEVAPYVNFVDANPQTPAKYDIGVHDCEKRFGARMPFLPPAHVEEFVPGESGDPILSDEEVLAICTGGSPGAINRAALEYDCPKLSHYNLFENPRDPTKGGREGGRLFDLTTPLFSDYSTKYRIVFMPPGGSAGWREGGSSNPSETLSFPPGTVIAKTFAFRTQAAPDGPFTEKIVETRLLIHRQDGFWQGMAYLWDADGQDATLDLDGEKVAVTWSYYDPDPDVLDPSTGTRARYVGSTDRYAVPHPNQCHSCHANDDRPAGAAPIGLKVRLLNRPAPDGSGENQLVQMIRELPIVGAPSLAVENGIATNAQRLPRFDVPGDRWHGFNPDQFTNNADGEGHADLQARSRAWLESNCAHCHNRKGLARNSGLFLDVFRKVDLAHGICKTPTAAGRGSGGHQYDIVPRSHGTSILSYRIESTDPGEQMPTIARSVQHTESIRLINRWIDEVVDSEYPDSSCAAGGDVSLPSLLPSVP